MIVLSPTGQLLGTTMISVPLTFTRLKIWKPDGYRYYRLCHVAADGNNPSSLSYLLPAVLLSPGDDPTLLPDWRPL